MKNIVLVGLKYDNNLGDRVINDVSRVLLKDAWTETHHSGIEIREVDMTGREGMETNPTKARIIRSLAFRVFRRLHSESKEKIGEYVDRHTIRAYFPGVIDHETIGIIFAGGGIIKYKVQNLPFYVDEITRIAEKRHIPVMFSAVGVEGYDEKDRRCLLLKKAINRKAVKIISTRDDDMTLKEKYCTNGQLILRVADPACSVSRFVPQKKYSSSNKTIGLGMVRKDLFTDYGIEVSEEKLLQLWAEIYRKLTDKGYQCKAFCNGAKSDWSFLGKWAEYMGFSAEQQAQVLIDRPESAEELIQIIQSFDGIVAVRLHAGIIAYSCGIPFAALVWNQKQRFFGEQIGLPERFLESKDFSGDRIVDCLIQALDKGYQRIDKEPFCRTTEDAMKVFIEKFVPDKNT